MEKIAAVPTAPRKPSYFDIYNEQFKKQSQTNNLGLAGVASKSASTQHVKASASTDSTDKILNFLCEDGATPPKVGESLHRYSSRSISQQSNQQVPTISKPTYNSEAKRILPVDRILGPAPTVPTLRAQPPTSQPPTKKADTSVILREIFGPSPKPEPTTPRLYAEPAPPHPSIRSVVHTHDNVEKMLLSKVRNADFLKISSSSMPPYEFMTYNGPSYGGGDGARAMPDDFHKEFVPTYRYSNRTRYFKEQQPIPQRNLTPNGQRVDDKESHSSGQDHLGGGDMPTHPASEHTDRTDKDGSTIIDVLNGNMCQLVRRVERFEDEPAVEKAPQRKSGVASPHVVKAQAVKSSSDAPIDDEAEKSAFDRLLAGILNPYVPKHYKDPTEQLHRACVKHRITMSIVYSKESILELSKSPQSHLPCTQLLKLPTELIAAIVSPHYGHFTPQRYERQREAALARRDARDNQPNAAYQNGGSRRPYRRFYRKQFVHDDEEDYLANVY